jgi:uncharacterized membrane protein
MIPTMECSTHSRVVSVDYWFFVNSSVSTFIMARTSLLLMHSSSSSPAGGGGGGGGGGCTYFGGMVNGKQKATQLVIG